MKINIHIEDICLTAELNNTPTAKHIAAQLPFEGRANRWGEEIYFEIPVSIALTEDAVQDVPVGALAYWPTGRAMCIFFGPTPVSTTDKPRAYSPVNVFGHLLEAPKLLTKVKDGAFVKVF
jgi:hypothetical protein